MASTISSLLRDSMFFANGVSLFPTNNSTELGLTYVGTYQKSTGTTGGFPFVKFASLNYAVINTNASGATGPINSIDIYMQNNTNMLGHTNVASFQNMFQMVFIPAGGSAIVIPYSITTTTQNNGTTIKFHIVPDGGVISLGKQDILSVGGILGAVSL